jgi:LPXTG-motif cell wall-anchored protein
VGEGQEAAGAALRETATSQSSGAIQSPALLIVGLALVFGGGVVLAVRNRARIGSGGPPELG